MIGEAYDPLPKSDSTQGLPAGAYNLDSLEGRAWFLRDVKGLWMSYPDGAARVDFLKKAASVARLTPEEVLQVWGVDKGADDPPKRATAIDMLDEAARHMKERAKAFDRPEGERSMGATISAFNAITGRDLRESEGWLIMALLKMVRGEQNGPHRDSAEDLVAYSSLYGEARLGGR